MAEPAADAPPPAPDPVLVAAAEAVALPRAEARSRLDELWAAIVDDDPLHRCALAHALADVQDDPSDELAWDLLALTAADSVTDERMARSGAPGPARGMRPSLHLNVADALRRLGRSAEARQHVAAARSTLDALSADGYRTTISAALDRVEAGLDGGTVAGPDQPP
jgi:hypothetical protein